MPAISNPPPSVDTSGGGGRADPPQLQFDLKLGVGAAAGNQGGFALGTNFNVLARPRASAACTWTPSAYHSDALSGTDVPGQKSTVALFAPDVDVYLTPAGAAVTGGVDVFGSWVSRRLDSGIGLGNGVSADALARCVQYPWTTLGGRARRSVAWVSAASSPSGSATGLHRRPSNPTGNGRRQRRTTMEGERAAGTRAGDRSAGNIRPDIDLAVARVVLVGHASGFELPPAVDLAADQCGF